LAKLANPNVSSSWFSLGSVLSTIVPVRKMGGMIA
jgi:hypothetical protein